MVFHLYTSNIRENLVKSPGKITINVPLFLEVRDFMFFRREKHIISLFAGFFEGAETFLTSKLS
jgi:hypothetical protein